MRRHLATATLSSLLLIGCATVGPDYVRPATAAPETFSETRRGTNTGAIEEHWWASFNDPVLDEFVQRARSSNLDLAVASARVLRARAVLREAGWSRAPAGDVATGYERRRLTTAETGFGEADIELYRIGADATWEIDLFGRHTRRIEAAAAEFESAEARLAATQISITAEVARTYFNLRGAENEVRILEALRANQTRSFATIRQLRDAGAASDLDVIRAESQLRAVEALTPLAIQNAVAARNALAILIGVRPDQMIVASEPQMASVPTSIAIGEPAALLRRRPDVAAAERQLAAATARIGIATSELYPSVQVSGSLGLVAGSLDAFVSGGAASWVVAPALRWAFLDLGRVRARIAVREAETQEALANYQQAVLIAFREAEDAFAAYSAATEALRLRMTQAALDRRAADLARIRFTEGKGVFLDVLDAERVRLNSEIAAVQAATAHRLAIVAIHKALGGGWRLDPSMTAPDMGRSIDAAEKRS